MTYNLEDRARELFKDEAQPLQSKWIEAVTWLRTRSRIGWLLDSSGKRLS